MLTKLRTIDFSKIALLVSWRPYFIIFTIGFLLYSQTLWFGFTYLDDNNLILDKAAILEDAHNVGQIFSTDAFFSSDKFYYRPLLNLSLMLDAQVGGILPFIYHLDNILLHVIAASLVFYLLFLLTKRRSLAFWLSIFFLIHPVLSQAVAWIPGRNDSLLAIFILAAFIFFLKFLERPRLRLYLAYLLFLFLALLTKENTIALPLLVIFYFLFINQGNSLKTDRVLLVCGSAAVAFIWVLMRHLALGSEPLNYFSAFWGIISNSPAILVDLGKLLFPVNLAVFPILQDSTVIYGIITVILLIIVWIFSKDKRNNYIVFGCLWFFLFLLPSFIRLNGLPDFLEHRLYLSFIGFLIVIVEITGIKNLNFRSRQVQIIGTIILLILAGTTAYHSRSFSNRLTFWQAAVKISPHSPLAQKNLGVMYYFAGDYIQAVKHDALALGLNPQEPMVHNNLGVIYMNQKKYTEAAEEFKNELEINPGYDKALDNLQTLYYRQKQLR